MARPATGQEALERARRDIASAKTVAQLRTAQSVLLPLELGLTLEQTAAVVGRSPAWVARERRRYIKGDSDFSARAQWGGRRNQHMTEQQEVEIVKRGIMLCAYSFTQKPREKIRELLEEQTEDVIPDSTLDSIILRVAQRTIPGGRASDLTRLSGRLTEMWLRERILILKQRGEKLAI